MVYSNTTYFIQNHDNSTIGSNYPNDHIFCWYNEVQLFTLIIISIWVSLTPLAIYSLCSQVRSDHVIPVFIINLLISDIIQVCCMIVQVARLKNYFIKYIIFDNVYNCGVMASIFFMTFIAMERYLLIAWPLLYRSQQKLKVSASVSVVTWILSIYIGIVNQRWLAAHMALPFPLLIFFVVRSHKALSTSHNVRSVEKRQIMAVLTAVLFAYILTFLPQIIIELLSVVWWWYIDITTLDNLMSVSDNLMSVLDNLMSVSCTLIQLNPLTDLLLYIVIKKWVSEKLLAFLCCCRKTNNVHQQTNSITITTCTWSASQRQTETEDNS